MAAQASRTRTSSEAFSGLDETLPWPRRLARAAAVAAVWVLSAIPLALGWQRCPVATFLHRPCPGCGMTRALRLLASGQVQASLRMHPLAVPVLLVGALVALSTVWVTFVSGTPAQIHRSPLARFALALAALVYGAMFVVWGLRAFGYFGGPVPV